MGHGDAAGYQPHALVRVGYASHDCLDVELDVGDVAGGALFEWFLSDPDDTFKRRFDSIGEWVAHVADLVTAGLCDRFEGERGPWLVVRGREHLEAAEAMRAVPAAHPVHGSTLEFGRDILEWPEHWQRANGLRPEHLRLRGASHTVAELFASSRAEEIRATVAARVVGLTSGEMAGDPGGRRVRVEDGTGSMYIACPPATTLLGPQLGRWFEFDVVVPAGELRPPPDPDTAARGVEDPADRLVAVWSAQFGGATTAIASAVRRMAPPQDGSASP